MLHRCKGPPHSRRFVERNLQFVFDAFDSFMQRKNLFCMKFSFFMSHPQLYIYSNSVCSRYSTLTKEVNENRTNALLKNQAQPTANILTCNLRRSWAHSSCRSVRSRFKASITPRCSDSAFSTAASSLAAAASASRLADCNCEWSCSTSTRGTILNMLWLQIITVDSKLATNNSAERNCSKIRVITSRVVVRSWCNDYQIQNRSRTKLRIQENIKPPELCLVSHLHHPRYCFCMKTFEVSCDSRTLVSFELCRHTWCNELLKDYKCKIERQSNAHTLIGRPTCEIPKNTKLTLCASKEIWVISRLNIDWIITSLTILLTVAQDLTQVAKIWIYIWIAVGDNTVQGVIIDIKISLMYQHFTNSPSHYLSINFI